MRIAPLALALALALAPTVAGAQAPAAQEPAVRGPWADVLVPERREARRWVRQGLFFLLLGLARSGEFDDAPYVQLERALARFDYARAVLPDDVDLAYYRAVALSRWSRPAPDGSTRLRVDEAIEAFEHVRRLDPDYLPSRVAFALASLHARLAVPASRRHEALRRAVREYEIAIDRHVPDPTRLRYRTYLPTRFEDYLAALFTPIRRSTLHGNLAENLMLLGELDRAVAHYRIAREQAEDPFGRTLVIWGLALALHRSGDHAAALAAALEAVEADPLAGSDRPEDRAVQSRWGAFAVLHHPDVFFEPSYELHAYHALGYEAFAASSGDPRGALSNALAAWRRFLAEGGTTSPYAQTARAQVSRLEAALDELGEPPAGSRGRALRSGATVWLPAF